MAKGKKSNELQIPLLTEIVEHSEQGEDDFENDDVTQPRDEPEPLVSKSKIDFIVQSTLARYLVVASREISELIHREIKKKQKE